MNIIYRITYLPHQEAATPPYHYIGSSFDYDGKYMGSPASSQKDWYTDGLSIKAWWRKETQKHPEHFQFEVLESHPNATCVQLVEEEKRLHLNIGVKDHHEYFNMATATSGWVSSPKTEHTRKKMSASTKAYWNSPEGKLKRERLAERNRATQSEIMLNRWKNPTEKMKTRAVHGRPKGSKNKGPYKFSPKPSRWIAIEVDGIQYDNAKEAAQAHGVSISCVRKRCRANTFPDWSTI